MESMEKFVKRIEQSKVDMNEILEVAYSDEDSATRIINLLSIIARAQVETNFKLESIHRELEDTTAAVNDLPRGV